MVSCILLLTCLGLGLEFCWIRKSLCESKRPVSNIVCFETDQPYGGEGNILKTLKITFIEKTLSFLLLNVYSVLPVCFCVNVPVSVCLSLFVSTSYYDSLCFSLCVSLSLHPSLLPSLILSLHNFYPLFLPPSLHVSFPLTLTSLTLFLSPLALSTSFLAVPPSFIFRIGQVSRVYLQPWLLSFHEDRALSLLKARACNPLRGEAPMHREQRQR